MDRMEKEVSSAALELAALKIKYSELCKKYVDKKEELQVTRGKLYDAEEKVRTLKQEKDMEAKEFFQKRECYMKIIGWIMEGGEKTVKKKSVWGSLGKFWNWAIKPRNSPLDQQNNPAYERDAVVNGPQRMPDAAFEGICRIIFPKVGVTKRFLRLEGNNICLYHLDQLGLERPLDTFRVESTTRIHDRINQKVILFEFSEDVELIVYPESQLELHQLVGALQDLEYTKV